MKLIFIFHLFIVSIYSLNINPSLNRKDFINHLIVPLPFLAINTDKKPIVVIGGFGKTGYEISKALIANKNKVRVISRNNHNNDLPVDFLQGDITNPKLLPELLNDASAVIFTPNAKYNSDDTQTFNDINNLGLLNVAKTCVDIQIPRLFILSASCQSCIDNPNAKFDKTCGLKCDHCRAIIDGEKAVKEIYANKRIRNKQTTYTICRVGMITNGEPRDVKELEINQDFTKSGMISRSDIAQVCINSLNNPNTFDTTFEVYYKDTIQPYDVKKSLELCIGNNKSLEECFFGSRFKNKKPSSIDEAIKTPIEGTLFGTGNEFSGNNWNDLYKNLKKDNTKAFDLYDIGGNVT